MQSPPDPLAVSEIDHRIANNLALIASLVRLRSQAVKADAPLSAAEVQQLLAEVAQQIEAVAHLHRLLSQRPMDGELDVCVLLRNVCDAIDTSLTGAMTLKQTYEGQCLLTRERALPLALIVSELIANAAKYAHPAGMPCRVSLDVRTSGEGHLHVSVADDGVGFPEGFDPERDGGFGLRVIHALSRQIGAVARFQSTPLGLRFRLTAPVRSS